MYIQPPEVSQPKKPMSKSHQSAQSTDEDLLFTAPEKCKSIFCKQFHKHPSLFSKHEQSRSFYPPHLFIILRIRAHGKTENTELYIEHLFYMLS